MHACILRESFLYELLNALEGKPQGKVTHVEFRDTNWILCQDATHQGCYRGNQHEVSHA